MSSPKPYVLGISASHNGAACIMHGDEIVVAVQEERLTRRKRAWVHAGSRALCVNYCLDAAGLKPSDLDLVVVSVQGYSDDVAEDVWLNPDLRLGQNGVRAAFVPHHLAHAMSVFCTSPFEEAAVLVADGGGSPVTDLSPEERPLAKDLGREYFETISTYRATATAVVPLEKCFNKVEATYFDTGCGMPRFGSLGCMFEAVSKQIFGDQMQAGKVMGLAPYGRQKHPPSSFLSCDGKSITFSDEVLKLYTHNRRWPDCAAEYQDLACSVQGALEEAVTSLSARLHGLSGSRNLCLSGGVALNGIANEKLLAEGPFRDIYVYPAAEDSGVAVGAACHGVWQLTGRMPRSPLSTDEHGRRYDRVSIQRAVDKQPGVQPIAATDSAAVAAELLADGKVLGLFQGGSELGPRALGNRSILFDARRADGQEYLNTRIKGREAFRPFAPVCLLEEVESWFESGHSHLVSPFMLRVVSVKPDKRHIIPAVTHVDGSARLQTVTPANGVLYEIVHRFWRRTGVPVLLNTSFNVNAEPLVETPDDALLCMLHANIDACLLGDLLVEKADAASTLLDLTPQYTGTGITLKVDHPGVIAASAGSRLVVTTATEWGPSTALVGGSTLAVLQLVDGRKTGKDIARILGEQKGVTEQHVNSELVSLVRRRVLRFAAPACPPVDVATAVAG